MWLPLEPGRRGPAPKVRRLLAREEPRPPGRASFKHRAPRWCRRIEVPTPLAASSFRNFKSKSGTRIIELLVPLSLPKFVPEPSFNGRRTSEAGALAHRRQYHALDGEAGDHGGRPPAQLAISLSMLSGG